MRRRPGELRGWVGLAGPHDFLPIGDAPRSLLLAPREDRNVNPLRNTLGLAERLQRAGASSRAELLGGSAT